MKNTKYILVSMLLFFSGVVFAQQQSIFTLYRYHMNLVNPAYAGVGDQTFLTASFRSQWTGVKNAPETQAVSFGTGVGHNLGLGLSMVNDRTFIEKQIMVGIDFSYKIE